MKKWVIDLCALSLGIVCGVYSSAKLNILTDVSSTFVNNKPSNVAVNSVQDFQVEYNNDLVLVDSVYDGFVIDLRYATDDNITKEVLYPSSLCYLQKNTLDKLIQANEELKTMGYRIKIWDAYRPLAVQKKLWAVLPNSNYIANPFANGSNHNRGAAVDITMVDLKGNAVEVPTGFDEFGEKSHRGYKSSSEARKNVEILTSVMVKYGFDTINTEWWHYDDVDAKKYPVQDYSFRELLKK